MTKGRAKVCIAAIWFISSIPTIISLSYGAESRFSPKSAKCLTTIYTIKDASVLFRVVWQSIVIIPLISIVIINILLFTIASKSRKRHSTSSRSNNTRALITVSALSGVFLASLIPVMIWTAWNGIDPTSTPDILEEIGFNAVMINSFSNPILYTITNKRFGSFVWQMLTGVIPSRNKSGVIPSRNKSGVVPSRNKNGVIPSRNKSGVIPSWNKSGVIQSRSKIKSGDISSSSKIPAVLETCNEEISYSPNSLKKTAMTGTCI